MKKHKTQRELIISRLKRGWTDSLQAVKDCGCIKLTTRVNEADFIAHVAALGYVIERKEDGKTRYVSYRLKKVKK